ncbi:hypothetical protein OROMI_011483 [Orobanche minor]
MAGSGSTGGSDSPVLLLQKSPYSEVMDLDSEDDAEDISQFMIWFLKILIWIALGICLSIEIPCACAGKTGCEFTYTPNGLVREDFLNDFVSKSRSVSQHDLFYCRDCLMAQFSNGNLIGKCKGHVNRRFIKECWYKCGCGMNCGNRVVQRGITAKLQNCKNYPLRCVYDARMERLGSRTLEDVAKGAFLYANKSGKWSPLESCLKEAYKTLVAGKPTMFC